MHTPKIKVMKPWWNHVLKHLPTKQYRSSQQKWWNTYHIMFAICAAGGTKEKIYKNITMHNWVVDSCKLDKKWNTFTMAYFDRNWCESAHVAWAHHLVVELFGGDQIQKGSRCALFGYMRVIPCDPPSRIPISKYLESEGWKGFTSNTDNPAAFWWGEWAKTIYSIDISMKFIWICVVLKTYIIQESYIYYHIYIYLYVRI